VPFKLEGVVPPTNKVRKARPPRDRYAAWIVMGKMCPIINSPVDFWDCHLDHIVPIARGGVDEWENLVMLSSSFNLSRGTKKYPQEFRDRLLAIAAKKKSDILELLDDPTFRIPKAIQHRDDLASKTVDGVMDEVGTTPRWSYEDTHKLVEKYLSSGAQRALRQTAEEISKSYQSCVMKLVSLGIYCATFAGQLPH